MSFVRVAVYAVYGQQFFGKLPMQLCLPILAAALLLVALPSAAQTNPQPNLPVQQLPDNSPNATNNAGNNANNNNNANSGGQDDKTIEILSADLLEVETQKNQELRKLVGNVALKQGNTTIYCDSAYFYISQNNAQTFGHVRIEQGDSVRIRAEKLFFNGDKRTATLSKNVYLSDKKAEITADSLHYYLNPRKAVLRKNVHLTDKKSDITADKLDYDVGKKYAELRDNVHLVGRNADITAARLNYDVNTKDAELLENVVLKSEKMTLKTQHLDYNINTQEGKYQEGGQIQTQNKTLDSQTANYYGSEDMVKFRDNVHLKSPDYDLSTPVLDYNLSTEVADFKGPTTIRSKDGDIKTNAGTYDSKNDRIDFKERTTIQNKNQNITADQLRYNKKAGYSRAEGNVLMIDTVEKMTLRSRYANFYDKDNRMEAYQDVLLINIIDNDTLYLAADTLISREADTLHADKKIVPPQIILPNNAATAQSRTDNAALVKNDSIAGISGVAAGTNNNINSNNNSTTPPRNPPQAQTETKTPTNKEKPKIFHAYRHVKILKSNIQAVCDSLVYSLADSAFRFYYGPIIWSEQYQMNADTILLFTERSKPKHAALIQNAYIGNEHQPYVYDQVKGKQITALFTDGKINRMIAAGNAESIYYAQDEQKKYVGANKSLSSQMVIYFTNEEVDKITFIQKPEATFYPIKQVTPKQFMLRGFKWLADKRPHTINDLYPANKKVKL